MYEQLSGKKITFMTVICSCFMDSLSCVRSIGPFTCVFTSATHSHSRCGNHSDCCKCSPNYLKGLRLSQSKTERKEGRLELCVICVAYCGGVMLQVAARLTLPHRQTVKRKSNWQNQERPYFVLFAHTQRKMAKFWNATWLKHQLISGKTRYCYLIFLFSVSLFVDKHLYIRAKDFYLRTDWK